MGKKDILQQAFWGLLVLLAACAPTVSQTPTVAQGQTRVQVPQVVTSLTAEEMEAILRAAGYRYERLQQGQQGQVVVFALRMGNFLAFLGLVDCKGGRCESLQILTPFPTRNRPTLERINAWNREKRFSRAYLDQDGNPVLEWDLGLGEGVTLETVVSFLRIFEANLSQFATWIGFR
jgi:hypothetical protein